MTMIWLPKYQDLEMPAPKVGFAGLYRLVVKEHDGSVARDTGWFKNIITNVGLDSLQEFSAIGIMSLGTGTSTPAETDTSLQAFAQFSNESAPGGGFSPAWPPDNTTPPYVTGIVRAYRFGIGRLNGTYSEVGVSNTTNGTALFSRALIVDGGGSPTTITVGSSQQLDAYYTLRKLPPLVDTSNTVTIGGVSYTATGRAALVGSASMWFPSQGFNFVNGNYGYTMINAGATLGAVTGSISGGTSSTVFYTGATTPAYVPGSYSRSSSIFASTDQANVSGGIRGMQVFWNHSAACFQYVLNASIPKDNTKTLVLNFGVSWARA